MVKRGIFLVIVIAFGMALTACSSTDQPAVTSQLEPAEPITARDLQIVMGQTIYVPAYSEIFYGTSRTMQLAVTLAIHNTDFDTPIFIQSAQYFDTDGKLVRDYVSSPVEISPLATTGFVIDDQDTSGGWGANFIVQWGAEEPVYEPVIEAIMVSTQGTHGISIISPGRVVSQIMPESTEVPTGP